MPKPSASRIEMLNAEAIRHEGTKGFELGVVGGWQDAGSHVLSMAALAFKEGDDERADMLRNLAGSITDKAKTLRKAYDEKYPKLKGTR